MSRIGRKPVVIPAGVQVKRDGQMLRVEGAKGKLAIKIPEHIGLRMEPKQIVVEPVGSATERPDLPAQHGLYRALIGNMVTGVSEGFTKTLEIVGVGYRAQLQGKQLTLSVGLSHQVSLAIPEGIVVEVPKTTSVIIRGANRHDVGQFAADIRAVAPPEPYKGKGIKYAGEVIRRKAGKAASGSGAKKG